MLLDSWEVLAETALDDHVSQEVVRIEIGNAELEMSQSLIGEDMYDILVGDRTYTTHKVYESGATYQNGDHVLYGRKMWKCLINNTTIAPISGASWQAAQKFSTACYNSAWDKGLKKAVAYMVAARVNLRTSFRSTERGVIEAGSDFTAMVGGGVKGVAMVQTQDRDDAMLHWRAFLRWLKGDDCLQAFSEALFYGELCESQTVAKYRVKRIGSRPE